MRKCYIAIRLSRSIRFIFQVVQRSSGEVAVGSTCCFGENGWTCCRREQNCCISLGSGSLEIPGFRPMCCHLASISVRAHCCSTAAQKSGVIPECCNSPRVKPKCCTTTENKFICCKATTGLPSCCSNIPTYEVQTTKSVMLVPVGYQSTQSCCHSSRPEEYCCPRTHTITYTALASDHSTAECCTHACCAKSAYVSACCRRKRRSCCGISNSERIIECCNQQGLTPSCCPGQPRSIRGHADTPPRRMYETSIQQPNPYQEIQVDHPRSQITHTSPLSCCKATDIQSCCTSGLQRSGGHPLCCPQSNTGNAQYTGISGSYRIRRLRPGRFSTQQHHQYEQWTSKGDDIKDLLRSEELQTLEVGTNSPTSEVTNTPTHGNPYHGRRQALCSRIPYDTSQFICCSGVLQVKIGLQPACCGKSSFDQSTQTCCNGQVQYVCPVADNSHN